MLMQEFVYLSISKNTLKKPLTKASLEEPDEWQIELFSPAGKDSFSFCRQSLLATPPYAAVLADAQPAALLAGVSLAVVLADTRPTILLALASFAVVLEGALEPPHCLHPLLRRLCSQMLAPPHCLHWLIWR
jgi:hypothetical protein